MFCVYLTTYRGNKLPMFYIGSSSIEKVNSGYKGSVSSQAYKKIWHNEIKESPHLFKTIIVSTHQTRKEALCKEDHFHRTLNVVINPLYTNKSRAVGCFGVIEFTKETRIKMSKASKGKPKQKDHREKIAAANRLKAKDVQFLQKLKHASQKNLEWRLKISESLKGKLKSEEHCRELSKAHLGKKTGPCSKERAEAIRASLIGKKQRIIECPYCQKNGGYAAMKRFHFDNCKNKLC